jgi:ribonuclease HI
MEELSIYTDGGSRGNPGNSAIGIVILDNDKNIILNHKEFLGIGTNNQAEYKAIIKALNLAKQLNPKKLRFYSDSELVVKQLRGEYKINNPELKRLNEEVSKLSKDYSCSFEHVRRTNEFIAIADALVNKALDEELSL